MAGCLWESEAKFQLTCFSFWSSKEACSNYFIGTKLLTMFIAYLISVFRRGICLNLVGLSSLLTNHSYLPVFIEGRDLLYSGGLFETSFRCLAFHIRSLPLSGFYVIIISLSSSRTILSFMLYQDVFSPFESFYTFFPLPSSVRL